MDVEVEEQMVSVAVAEPPVGRGRLVGLIVAKRPEGETAEVSVTVPLKLLTLVTVIVEVAQEDCPMLKLFGLAEIVKSDCPWDCTV